MDRLSSMATFVKAVDLGSFAAAAAALTMSPQMVAKHVAYLEARLGTRLLNRTTRRQSLTEIGRTYYERCKAVLAEAEWADAAGDHATGTPRGRLRINAPVSFGTHTLTPVVTRYLRQYPEVEIDLTLSDRYVDLVEEGFEAVFRIGRLADSSMTARALRPFRVVACASPAYLRERGAPADPSELHAHQCLVYAGTRAGASDWRFVREGRPVEVKVRGQLQVNNATALLSGALAGFGIAFIAEDLARAPLASGQLMRVLPDFDTPSRPMHLLYHADRRLTTKLRSFIDVIVHELGPESPAQAALDAQTG
ncbi:LysR family transcriptional regulator [Mitsuaria sp. 7]|uniref:LysR family transcriptional regulator n=1 Tax=Mitsuaria sp. 7 TaxID=1658665 RepID=UPI0007DDDD28|nr:LysR family transcriptional regulator [Mitsuaria sp. 7]ANH67394.1 LysR family transcriptional regulator [Mitsuaria sp. 7]